MLTGEVKDLEDAEGLLDIVDFNFCPFGNNYFVTKECGGAGDYDHDARQCWNDKCGRDASNRPADCFTGAVVGQHGDSEPKMNRYFACAKKFESDVKKYMNFVRCMEAAWPYTDEPPKDMDGLAKNCSTTFAFAPLKSCYDGADGAAALAAEAQNTPEHDGVPYVEINGKEAERTGLISQVCAAYTGQKPAGCSKLLLV